MALLNVTINGTERQIDTDDLTIGFYEDLEQAQATGKMRDFIPFERAVAVPPTSA